MEMANSLQLSYALSIVPGWWPQNSSQDPWHPISTLLSTHSLLTLLFYNRLWGRSMTNLWLSIPLQIWICSYLVMFWPGLAWKLPLWLGWGGFGLWNFQARLLTNARAWLGQCINLKNKWQMHSHWISWRVSCLLIILIELCCCGFECRSKLCILWLFHMRGSSPMKCF